MSARSPNESDSPMGSISYTIPARSTARAAVAKYVRQGPSEVIASNSAPTGGGDWSGVYYAAHREPDDQVWASITLFTQCRGQVVIKAMSESMGPTAVGVGKRVLTALTAPVGEYAEQWRAEAADYHRRRDAAMNARGQWIRLATPIKLGSRVELAEVRVVDMRRWQTRSGGFVRPWWDWFLSEWAPLP